jgi:hypothetical protein
LCVDARKMNLLLFLYVVDEYDQLSILLFLLEFYWGLGTFLIPTKMRTLYKIKRKS